MKEVIVKRHIRVLHETEKERSERMRRTVLLRWRNRGCYEAEKKG